MADDVRSTPSLNTGAEEDAAGPSEEEEKQEREASTKSLGDYLSDDGSSVREADEPASPPPPSAPPSAPTTARPRAQEHAPSDAMLSA